jgi:hypothetical protein
MNENKFHDNGNLGVLFGRTISNMCKNNIFPTVPCALVKIQDIAAICLCFMHIFISFSV